MIKVVKLPLMKEMARAIYLKIKTIRSCKAAWWLNVDIEEGGAIYL